MPLELRPLRASDSLSWIRTRSLAYYGPTHETLHCGPVSETSIQGIAEDRKREIGDANVWHWKVVDTELSRGEDDPKDNGGQTIAVAVWKMMNVGSGSLDDRSSTAEKEDVTEYVSVPAETKLGTHSSLATRFPSFLPPELRLDALASIFDPLDEARNELMGTETPFFMLNSLATHPDHQNRGAGKLLLDWGMMKADDEELMTYLDATQIAKPIYEKRGFEVKRVMEWDRTIWGGDGADVHYCMLRQPRSLDVQQAQHGRCLANGMKQDGQVCSTFAMIS